MLFNSYTFLFVFLPITLVVTLGASALGFRALAKVLLLTLSLGFYGWANPRYLVVLLALIVFNYAVCGLLIRLDEGDRRRRPIFLLGLVANLGALAYFKYTNFAVAAFSDAFGLDIHIARVALPLGLSFITFQKIALLVDTYNGGVRAIGLLDYGLFVTFFPQLIAGPIVHHREIFPQLADQRTLRFSGERLATGSALFAIGLFKKAVLADSIAGFANRVFDGAAHGDHPGLLLAWLGAIAYTLQLYFDFSGYCDMAVGLGRMFAIDLPLNFDSPFKATNIIDFWRRWHMSLTRFLTECIYNPILLAVNRRRAARGIKPARRGAMSFAAFAALVVYPTMVTMFLAGIWHGAGYTFMIFGALHGAYLVVNHAWRSFGAKRAKAAVTPSRSARLAGQALTLGAVVVAFVFFRADSVRTALRLLGDMVGRHGLHPRPSLPPVVGVLALGAIALVLPNSNQLVGAIPVPDDAPPWLRLRFQPTLLWGLAVGVLALAALLQLDSSTEFLYFND